MVYLHTGFIMLPLHRNDGMEPKRRLAYTTEIADFFRKLIVAKKFRIGGKRGRVGRVSGNKTFFFGLSFIPAEDIDQTKLAFIYRGLKHTGPHPRINNTKM